MKDYQDILKELVTLVTNFEHSDFYLRLDISKGGTCIWLHSETLKDICYGLRLDKNNFNEVFEAFQVWLRNPKLVDFIELDSKYF